MYAIDHSRTRHLNLSTEGIIEVHWTVARPDEQIARRSHSRPPQHVQDSNLCCAKRYSKHIFTLSTHAHDFSKAKALYVSKQIGGLSFLLQLLRYHSIQANQSIEEPRSPSFYIERPRKGNERVIDILKRSSKTPHTKIQIHLVIRPRRGTLFSRGRLWRYRKKWKETYLLFEKTKTLEFRRNEEDQDTRNGCESGASGDFFPRGGGQLGDDGKEKYTPLAVFNPFYSANLIKNLKPKFKNIPFFSINLIKISFEK